MLVAYYVLKKINEIATLQKVATITYNTPKVIEINYWAENKKTYELKVIGIEPEKFHTVNHCVFWL